MSLRLCPGGALRPGGAREELRLRLVLGRRDVRRMSARVFGLVLRAEVSGCKLCFLVDARPRRTRKVLGRVVAVALARFVVSGVSAALGTCSLSEVSTAMVSVSGIKFARSESMFALAAASSFRFLARVFLLVFSGVSIFSSGSAESSRA